MADWPATLPLAPLRQGYARTGASPGRDDFVPDSGPVISRATATGRPPALTAVWSLTANQRAAFWAFYRGELEHGSLPFFWTDPRSGAALTARFTGGTPQEAQAGPHFTITATVLLLTVVAAARGLRLGAPVLGRPDVFPIARGLRIGAPRLAEPAAGVADGLVIGAPVLGAPEAPGQPVGLVIGAPVLGLPGAGAANGVVIGAPVLGLPGAVVPDGVVMGAPVLGVPTAGLAEGIVIAAPVLGVPQTPGAADGLVIGAPVLGVPAAGVAEGLVIGAPVLGQPIPATAGPPVFRSSSGAQESASIAVPAGAQTGDLLVLGIVSGEGSEIATPSGFTQTTAEAQVFDGGLRLRMFHRVRQSGDGSSITLPGSAPSAICHAYEAGSFDASDPIDGTRSANSGLGSPPTGGSITTTEQDAKLVLMAFDAEGQFSSPPSGMTPRHSIDDALVSFDETLASAGASGDRAGSTSVFAWLACMAAVRRNG